MDSQIVPTQSHVLWDGAVEVHCFGRQTGNWSMRGRTRTAAEENNPGVVERVAGLARRYNCRLYAPHPQTFNAEIVSSNDMTVWRSTWAGNALYRGVEADGVVLLRPGNGFALASADCPTLIVQHPRTGLVVAAHAGRDSLDRRADGSHDLVATAVRRLRADPKEAKAFLCCGIGPEHFRHDLDHPEHGESNLYLVSRLGERTGALYGPREQGRLDLKEIVRHLLSYHGVPRWSFGHDGVCTYLDRDGDARYVWHSQRRERDGRRNLVLVIRRK